MLKATDFQIQAVQLTGFAQQNDGLRPTSLLKAALVNWPNEYDADPVSIPWPRDAPPDVPRVILANRSGTSRLEVSPQRLSLIAQFAGDDQADIHSTASTFASRVATAFAADNTPLGRLGLVITRVAPVDEPAGRLLANQYFRESWLKAPFNRPETLEIHAHKRYELLPGLMINSWVRVKSATVLSSDSPAVSVEQDLNTLEESRQSSNLSAADVASLTDRAMVEMESILGLYFPIDQS